MFRHVVLLLELWVSGSAAEHGRPCLHTAAGSVEIWHDARLQRRARFALRGTLEQDMSAGTDSQIRSEGCCSAMLCTWGWSAFPAAQEENARAPVYAHAPLAGILHHRLLPHTVHLESLEHTEASQPG